MVVSSAPQLRATYKLWHRFSMPQNGGSHDAVAVPDYVADQLTSAYTLMVTSMVINVWCICFALGFFYIMRHNAALNPLSSNLWNNRASMVDSLISMISKKTEHWRRWWVYPAILIILGCWVAQTVLSIVLPPLIFIDTAAPVNVDAIVVPPNDGTSNSAAAQLFALDVPATLRAVGGALVAASDVQQRVTMTKTDLGTTADDDQSPLERFDYSYYVTGAELGLQHFSTLQLNVQGACTTEYGWLVSSDNSSGYTNDTYAVFGDAKRNGNLSLSLYDGPSPTAFFYVSDTAYDGAGLGNTTWAALVSSVDRVSFSASTDALYYTGATTGTLATAGNHSVTTSSNVNLGGAGYRVQPRRPALSCWQADVWSYRGRNTTVTALNATAVPGLDLPLPLQLVLARYLGAPRVATVGLQMGLGALASSTTALGSVFDGGSSSAFTDLQRLVLAAYIATANTLTDTTLSSTYLGARTQSGNLVYDQHNTPMAGAGDFVVWTSDVSTLSVRAAIVIPVVSALSWLLMLLVINFTPLRRVNALDALELQKEIHKKYPDAHLTLMSEAAARKPSVNISLPGPGKLLRNLTLRSKSSTLSLRKLSNTSGATTTTTAAAAASAASAASAGTNNAPPPPPLPTGSVLWPRRKPSAAAAGDVEAGLVDVSPFADPDPDESTDSGRRPRPRQASATSEATDATKVSQTSQTSGLLIDTVVEKDQGV